MWIWHTRLSVTPSTVADLRERETLVVVEREHEPLAIGHAVDRVGEHVLHLVDLERRDRVVAPGRRSCRRRWRVPPRSLPRCEQLVERDEADEADLRQRLRELGLGHAELGGDLGVLGRALQLVLELRVRALDRRGPSSGPSAAPSRSSAARR